MQPIYTKQEIKNAIVELVKKNGLSSCYIRPLIYRGLCEVTINPVACPVEIAIAAWERGDYFSKEAIHRGIDVMVSSWRRMVGDTFPAMAKSIGNYSNAQLLKLEAIENGYTEAIGLNDRGMLAEGPGENIFLVKDNTLYTPSISCGILSGITRDSVIHIARELGYTVKETELPREFLYIADEMFFTGTSAEITPIRSVDRIQVGQGEAGPVTTKIQEEFFRIINNGDERYHNWFTYIN